MHVAEESTAIATRSQFVSKDSVIERPFGLWDDVERVVVGHSVFVFHATGFVNGLLFDKADRRCNEIGKNVGGGFESTL
jgi:hypothetical protein